MHGLELITLYVPEPCQSRFVYSYMDSYRQRVREPARRLCQFLKFGGSPGHDGPEDQIILVRETVQQESPDPLKDSVQRELMLLGHREQGAGLLLGQHST